MLALFAFAVALSVPSEPHSVAFQKPTSIGPETTDLPKPSSQTWAFPNNEGFIEFKWEFRDTGQTATRRTSLLRCERECEGQKHFAHRACDASCDLNCTVEHKVLIEPSCEIPGYHAVFREVDAAARRFGITYPTFGLGDPLYRESVLSPMDDPKRALLINVPCWSAKPCSASQLLIPEKVIDVEVKWRLYRQTPRPDGSLSTVEGPSGAKVAFSLYLPQPGPYQAVETVHCNCDIATPVSTPTGTAIGGGTPAGGGRVPTPGGAGAGNPPGKVPTVPGGAIKPPGTKEVGMSGPWGAGELRIGYQGASYNGPPIDGKFLESVGFNVQIPSIQNALVSASNRTDKPIRFTICSGVMFICIRGDGQDTILVADLNFHLPPMTTQTKLLRIVGPGSGQLGRVGARDPNAFTPLPLAGRVLCLDIDKPMPTPGDAYKIGFGPSPEVVAIARKGGTQPIQGSWDQARIWIAEGAATIDKVNSILIPPVAEAQYVRALQECAEWGGIDFLGDRYRPCLQPKLAIGLEAGGKALRWFGETMARADGAGLAAYVSGNLDKFAAKYTDARANDHAERIASLAAGMLTGGPEAQSSALDLLLRGMPEAGRARLAARSELASVAAVLMISQDPALVGKALDVVEALKPKNLAVALVNLSPSLPKELRVRAADLVKK